MQIHDIKWLLIQNHLGIDWFSSFLRLPGIFGVFDIQYPMLVTILLTMHSLCLDSGSDAKVSNRPTDIPRTGSFESMFPPGDFVALFQVFFSSIKIEILRNHLYTYITCALHVPFICVWLNSQR